MTRHVMPLLLLWCAACSTDLGPTVEIHAGGRRFVIPVEISADDASRQRGLSERDELPPDRGMVFLYPEASHRSFWMKNCVVPIDVAFVDDDGRIVNLHEMQPPVDPDRLRHYDAVSPVRVALEMPGGWFRSHGVAAGDRVILSPEVRAVEPR